MRFYAKIYDANWLTKGNCMIAPGVERVDTIKTDSGFAMTLISRPAWMAKDLSTPGVVLAISSSF